MRVLGIGFREPEPLALEASAINQPDSESERKRQSAEVRTRSQFLQLPIAEFSQERGDTKMACTTHMGHGAHSPAAVVFSLTDPDVLWLIWEK
jgi:hypothetical protein